MFFRIHSFVSVNKLVFIHLFNYFLYLCSSVSNHDGVANRFAMVCVNQLDLTFFYFFSSLFIINVVVSLSAFLA